LKDGFNLTIGFDLIVDFDLRIEVDLGAVYLKQSLDLVGDMGLDLVLARILTW